MKTLDAISLPLNQSGLIEASAGTGKTYTMANLYLRLLLGVGCKPLSVEQILVVTFTKAATQELRDRIRTKLGNVARWFQQPESKAAQQAFEDDPFLLALYQQVQTKLPEAILRLTIAEREMDLAAIFTIDSFCQKMLFQFAFHSGVRFDLDLQADEQELLNRLSEDTWRTLFYPMNLANSRLVAEKLKNPTEALKAVEPYLYGKLPTLLPEQQWINQNPNEWLARYQQFLSEAQNHWQTASDTIKQLIITELNKTYKKGEKKALNRRSYQLRWLENWWAELDQWAKQTGGDIPEVFERFCQEALNSKAEEGAVPLSHEYFAKNQQILSAYRQQFAAKALPMLQFQFLTRLRQKLEQHKLTHKEKSFGDMLSFLHQALFAAQGDALAAQIRALYPFAMIDEFQDTNQQQYEIFHRIFIDRQSHQGFIMIGDPKQSIYKFRGADIFTYLQAAEHVADKTTLNRNWRSLPALVEGTNRLFSLSSDSQAKPFLYQGIDFQAVESNPSEEQLCGQEMIRCYLLDTFQEQQAAELCAFQIQQQLKQAEQGSFFLQKNGENRPLAAQDITVLVRSHTQAGLMRQALLARAIPSVFYSERNSVFKTQEAQDLQFILQACLTPYHSGSLLSALGTQLWGLTAQEILHLKQDEQHWDGWVERFVHYQSIWQHQGILPMLHQIFVQQGIIQRINSAENAERRITDLLHLAELLQEAMPNLENETALLRWFQQQIAHPNGQSDEQKQRLESEENLVKIVTIHGSKGLEYPLVWLPFVGKNSQSISAKGITTYHDEQQQLRWNFGTMSDEVKQRLTQAEFAEDLRLLYVAITRAKYQLNLILPAQFDKGWNAMSYLLTNGSIGLGGEAPALTTAEYLAKKQFTTAIYNDPVQPDSWQAKQAEPTEISARRFTGRIQLRGQITSFTALQAQHKRLQSFADFAPLVTQDEAQDDDRYLTQAVEFEEISAIADTYSPYRFPHNTRVGNRLHQFFEQWDFSQPLALDRLGLLCDELGLDEAWLEPLQQWFEQIIHTPFGKPAFCLAQIQPKQRLSEWQFYLRLSNEQALSQLNQLLKEESRLAAQLPDLQLPQLEGFVRGFIDLIVQHEGKFYLLDYKSNFLGYLPQDYRSEKIEQVMGQYRYDLQYLLYTLALHRYLHSRLAENYDYERNFGGVAYLFLRGMNGEENSGVFFDKPSQVLIEKLDRLFD